MIRNLAADVEAFTSNAFLVAGLVDAGANFDVVPRVEERVDDLDAVVLTHTHPDHVGNVDDIRAAFDVETWGFDPDRPAVDNAIPDGGSVDMGLGTYEALHTPGHKDDHLCLYDAAAGVLFAGDLVFRDGGFGRTDLEEGDRPTLIRSIDRVADRADGDLAELHVGHGPSVLESAFDHVELAGRTARTR
ncbi:flavoprotein [Halobacteriales archaeon QS_6_71_20]|nr:MAG: flavoprotein [Halobacteriales archaeon QS_6_71_20]